VAFLVRSFRRKPACGDEDDRDTDGYEQEHAGEYLDEEVIDD
jgi:hypothetical protein